MQCQQCKKNSATIHLTEIVEGKRTESHLCEACAQKEGVAVKTQIPLNELLSSLLASQGPEGKGETVEGVENSVCPNCGSTWEDFREKSLLGCPYDYEVFKSRLEPILKKSQGGNTTHCGKIPQKLPEETKNNVELNSLKRQLEDAVRDEDYEKAAKIRDKIKDLE